MKKALTFCIAYLIAAVTYAQVDESKNFLYLYSDSVVYARDIYFARDFRGLPYFRVDGRRINPQQVKFFNSEEGYFANTSDLSLAGETSFSERIRKGKINLYDEPVIDWETHRSYYGRHTEPAVVFTKNYYNLDLGPVKKATYANLKSDMANDPQSNKLLKRYGSVKKAEKSFYIAAGTSILAGMAAFFINAVQRQAPGDYSFPNFGPSYLLMGAGVAFGVTGFTKTRKAPGYLKAAIDEYNR